MKPEIKIVKEIIESLRDRRGVGDEWDQIPLDIQGEIRREWRRIVKENNVEKLPGKCA